MQNWEYNRIRKWRYQALAVLCVDFCVLWHNDIDEKSIFYSIDKANLKNTFLSL